MTLSTMCPFWAEPPLSSTWLYLRRARSGNSFLYIANINYVSCTWKLRSVQACEQSFAGLQEETERMQLNSVPGFAETASTTRSTATHSFTLCKTRISVLLRFARGKFTVPLFSAASKQNCIWKRRGKITFCTPKSLSRLCFSIPLVLWGLAVAALLGHW